MRIIALFFASLLSACSCASHIPPPWELPGAAIGSAIENAGYSAKRKRLKQFLADNFDELKSDIDLSGGAALTKAYALSNIPAETQSSLLSEFQTHPEIYFQKSAEENLEAVTVAFMVYGD